jgi:hypothetical protein
MTTRNKIKILERVYSRVENGLDGFRYVGICRAVNVSVPKSISTINFMRDVGIKTPRGAGWLFWWPLDEDGKKKRLHTIRLAINRLKRKLKTKAKPKTQKAAKTKKAK